MNWFRKTRKSAGWIVLGADGAGLAAVHGEYSSATKPRLHRFAVQPADSPVAGLQRANREWHLARHQCATLLEPDEYQMVLVDAPNVARDELKSAMRWRVKDLLDFHVDDATLDVLDIPVPDDGTNRNHSMYAIAARNEAIEARVKQYQDAGIGLAVIDIQETAQRNIAALYEAPQRAIAALHCGERGCLLTVNYASELYLTRRFEAPLDQVTSLEPGVREDAHGRILLELQRSLDHFERLFRSIPIARLLLAPEPAPSGLAEFLASSLGLRVETIDINQALEVTGEPMSPAEQWRLFHLIGSSLRHQTVPL